jgi:hypothetical protein
MPDVFVSYSRDDRVFMHILRDNLHQVGFNVWIDEDNLTVGSYPQGTSPYGVLDMGGNVCEWCLNEYDTPANINPIGNARRAARGGSCYFDQNYARCSFRYWRFPATRVFDFGFRVCLGHPPSLRAARHRYSDHLAAGTVTTGWAIGKRYSQVCAVLV